jgi:hypothetical protein
MPLSRLDNLAPTIVPVATNQEAQTQICAHHRCRLTELPNLSASKTAGRRNTGSKANIMAGILTSQLMHGGTFAVASKAHDHLADGNA